MNAITSVSSDSGSLRYRQEIFGLSEPQIGSFGWGGYVERDQDAMKTMHRSMPLTEHGQLT